MFAPLLFALMTGCATEDYTSVYAVADRAPSLSADGIEALEHMGPTIVDGGINFAVYSENAERLELLIFEDQPLIFEENINFFAVQK